MAEKLDFGEPRSKAVVRTPFLQFLITRWDWSAGKAKDNNKLK